MHVKFVPPKKVIICNTRICNPSIKIIPICWVGSRKNKGDMILINKKMQACQFYMIQIVLLIIRN